MKQTSLWLTLLLSTLLSIPLNDTAIAQSAYVYKRPASVWHPERPKIVIIIDDMGNSFALGSRAVKLPGKLTFSFLPFTPASTELANIANDAGKEIMLHEPMSSIRNNALGPGALTLGMNKEDFLGTLRRSLEAVPYIKGINNHMGSELTQQESPMGWLMEELQQHQLYFIDSRTDPNTVAQQQATVARVPNLHRDVFLDNEQNPDYIADSFQQLVYLARRNGLAVAIAHPKHSTLDFLEQALLDLDDWQVELIFASEAISIYQNRLEISKKNDRPNFSY